ncbi:MAG TPA: FHA domain-containing protein [Kofleriaceae bacterium]|nr:FHA domain-containing protein [Kofleriaceae bacterium]
MKLPGCALALLLLAAGLATGLATRPAHAQSDTGSSYRAVIDRADLERSALGGYRLRVYVSALELAGAVLDLGEAKSFKMLVSKTDLDAPVAVGRFAASDTDLAIVFVIESSSEYADVLRSITEAADTAVLAELPEGRTQVGIVTYGDTVGAGKLGSLKAARGKLLQLSSEGPAPEPALLDALDRALRLLKGARTEPEGRPLRKLIVVVSDGRDRSNDRDRVTALGKRAAAAGVRIHTFAHAPNNARRPLLLLGELSKRSFGTFRWLHKDATTVSSWQSRFQQLRDEIKQQYVLTYFIDEDVSGRELKLKTSGRTELTSLNELKVPAAGCNGEPCESGYCAEVCTQIRAGGGRGIFGWIVLIIGVALGGIVLLGLIGFVMTKVQQARAKGPALPQPPGVGVPGMPGTVPPGTVPPGQLMQSRPPMATAPPYPTAPPSAQLPAVAPTSGPRIYVMAGPRAGETLALRHGFSLGAAPNNDFVIADGFASSHHAQLGLDPQGNCWITDLGSTNGTFVNGVRVTQKILDHGVTVKIGSTEIRFLAQ